MPDTMPLAPPAPPAPPAAEPPAGEPPTTGPAAAPAGPAARSARLRFALLVLVLGAAAGSLLLWSPTALLSGGLPAGVPGYWLTPVFVAVYAVGTLAFVPRPALNAAAGLLLGIQQGVAMAVLGTTLGAAMAFALGRLLGREALRPYLRGRLLLALDKRFTEQGFRSVLLLRLLPGLPFQAGNYGAAFSGVRFVPFLTATAIGVTPATAVYVTAAASADQPGSAAFLLSAGTIGVLVVGSLVGLWRAAARRRSSAA
ncbi:VTT domain-containing protein [Kitasatospora sp. CM 4170]|uniref:TVP38/TMEM64 family membrane protein n=1 Tax=Kitasatospora aburaviensis TaxID=67265 RepID=A0ABW1F4Z3_9ACTN|nr:VTT domain-containing protein [Kitasatospora sp. CM 4170]WNM44214.1 VTT domain-containing protein [Kitasatospora sp. CM 4170]